ncbi:MAG: hypothetical protein AB7S26_07480 [Sandaracinaceae bacterium]
MAELSNGGLSNGELSNGGLSTDAPSTAPAGSPSEELAPFDGRAPAPGIGRTTRRRARAIAEALFAREDGPPPAERLAWMEDELGEFFGHISARGRWIFIACVTTIYFLAPLLIGRLATLGALDVPTRGRAIEAIERSPLSLALFGAKAVLCILYFEHPDAAAEIGWDQECLL